MRRGLALEDFVQGLARGERRVLAEAITLVESSRPDQRALSAELLQAVLPRTGKAVRLGITGVPGVGKSTFIERLGLDLLRKGHRVAVLAIDPSSKRSGGSILGDKSRMNRLAREEMAFIRPSPAGEQLGGIARHTRESLLLCEAAGFDVVLVETVGVGQSETAVADMVDCFLVLMVPGAGDELQGIKKGVLELADIVAVNKADGDQLPLARIAQRDYAAALRYVTPRSEAWKPRCVLASGKTGDGLPDLWRLVLEHRSKLDEAGELAGRRARQQTHWLHAEIGAHLLDTFRSHPGVTETFERIADDVRSGRLLPVLAARQLVDRFLGR